MQLIGYLESPFIRRVAVTRQFLDVALRYIGTALVTFSVRAETLPECKACPLSG